MKTLLLSAHVADDEVLIALAASFPLVSLTSLTLGKFDDKFFDHKFERVDEEVVPSVTDEGMKALLASRTAAHIDLLIRR